MLRAGQVGLERSLGRVGSRAERRVGRVGRGSRAWSR